jgi:type IV secretory pathway VirB6-like protein
MTWDDVYNSARDFIYNYTELAIWLGLLLLLIILFWMMMYFIAVRRFIAVMVVMGAVLVWALLEYGYIVIAPR